jgi:hypothetical protein
MGKILNSYREASDMIQVGVGNNDPVYRGIPQQTIIRQGVFTALLRAKSGIQDNSPAIKL